MISNIKLESRFAEQTHIVAAFFPAQIMSGMSFLKCHNDFSGLSDRGVHKCEVSLCSFSALFVNACKFARTTFSMMVPPPPTHIHTNPSQETAAAGKRRTTKSHLPRTSRRPMLLDGMTSRVVRKVDSESPREH